MISKKSPLYFKKNANNIIKELEIHPILEIFSFFENKKRFYSTPCIRKAKKEKEKNFIKILISNEIAPAESIKREIATRKFLKNFKKIKIPLLINYNNKKFPYWFLSQYLEGDLVGYFYELHINDKDLNSLIADYLINLQQIPEKKLKIFFNKKSNYIWKREFSEYLNMIKSYQKELENKNLEKGIDFSKICQLFKKEENVFKKHSLVLSHGDFTLANFIKPSNKKELIVADWEHAHLDNFAYDISHLWIQLWRYPENQKKLISEFEKKLPSKKRGDFKKLFRLMVIAEALGELCWSIGICKKKHQTKRIETAKKTIKLALKNVNFYKNN